MKMRREGELDMRRIRKGKRLDHHHHKTLEENELDHCISERE